MFGRTIAFGFLPPTLSLSLSLTEIYRVVPENSQSGLERVKNRIEPSFK